MLVGSVVSLWRYPVKSMMGEELNAADGTERGRLGDRAYGPDHREGHEREEPMEVGESLRFQSVHVECPMGGGRPDPVAEGRPARFAGWAVGGGRSPPPS